MVSLTPELAGYWEDIRRELWAVTEQRDKLLANIERLTRELDEARADAWRYRWLKGRNPVALATVAWCCPEACQYPDPDRAIDAAMAAEERDGEPARHDDQGAA